MPAYIFNEDFIVKSSDFNRLMSKKKDICCQYYSDNK